MGTQSISGYVSSNSPSPAPTPSIEEMSMKLSEAADSSSMTTPSIKEISSDQSPMTSPKLKSEQEVRNYLLLCFIHVTSFDLR